MLCHRSKLIGPGIKGEARLMGNAYAEDEKKEGNELKATLHLEPEGLS
jgi:hypothetical protein